MIVVVSGTVLKRNGVNSTLYGRLQNQNKLQTNGTDDDKDGVHDRVPVLFVAVNVSQWGNRKGSLQRIASAPRTALPGIVERDERREVKKC